MCIALISTAHPSYLLIIIDNRDEYLRRPTSIADWWPSPNNHVLSSRDLARETHGTWMGVTRSGKVAVLTNYREDQSAQAVGVHSRGTIVNQWLTSPSTGANRQTKDFVQDLVTSQSLNTVGGFSLVCGYVDEPLAIVSNRAKDMEQIPWVATEKGQTRGLSNTSFGDRSWPKILDGERLMDEAIRAHSQAGEDEDALIDRLLKVLCTDTLPRIPEDAPAESAIHLLRHSIFVPVIGAKDKRDRTTDEVVDACVDDKTKVDGNKPNGHLDMSYMSGAYGTQKQTVLLVKPDGRVRYFERTLYDNDVNPIPVGKGDRSFEFTVRR